MVSLSLATQLSFQGQVALLGSCVLFQRFYACMSSLVHILAFSTNGHVFYLILHLVDDSMLVHNAFLLFLSFAWYSFVWVSVIHFINHLLIDRLFSVLY